MHSFKGKRIFLKKTLNKDVLEIDVLRKWCTQKTMKCSKKFKWTLQENIRIFCENSTFLKNYYIF